MDRTVKSYTENYGIIEFRVRPVNTQDVFIRDGNDTAIEGLIGTRWSLFGWGKMVDGNVIYIGSGRWIYPIDVAVRKLNAANAAAVAAKEAGYEGPAAEMFEAAFIDAATYQPQVYTPSNETGAYIAGLHAGRRSVGLDSRNKEA